MSDIAVKGPIAVQNIVPQTKVADQDAQKVGAGSVASAGAVPDPIGQSYEAISQSLSKFFPELTGDKVDILIAEASLKLKEIIGKTDTNELNAKEEQKRQNAAESRAAAEDAQKSFDEAKAAESKAKKSGLFGKIFGGIAAALSIIVGAVLIATGVGAALGVALIVGGVASTMMTVDQVVAEKHGTGIYGTICTKVMEVLGFSDEVIEEQAAKFDKAFQIIAISVIVISAVATVGIGFAGGATSAASSAASTAAAAGSAGARSTTTFATVVAKLAPHADRINKLSAGASSVMMAGSGVSTGTAAVYGFQAGKADAEAKRSQADVAEAQALNEHLNDFIDQILARISGANSQLNAMLDDIVASVKDRGDTLARAKFSG